jgi:hypothetical protein
MPVIGLSTGEELNDSTGGGVATFEKMSTPTKDFPSRCAVKNRNCTRISSIEVFRRVRSSEAFHPPAVELSGKRAVSAPPTPQNYWPVNPMGRIAADSKAKNWVANSTEEISAEETQLRARHCNACPVLSAAIAFAVCIGAAAAFVLFGLFAEG